MVQNRFNHSITGTIQKNVFINIPHDSDLLLSAVDFI